jgi:hypothetical protein
MRRMMTYLPGPHSGHDGVSCHASRDHGVSANCAFHGARGVRAFRALHARGVHCMGGDRHVNGDSSCDQSWIYFQEKIHTNGHF